MNVDAHLTLVPPEILEPRRRQLGLAYPRRSRLNQSFVTDPLIHSALLDLADQVFAGLDCMVLTATFHAARFDEWILSAIRGDLNVLAIHPAHASAP
jgi:hypothetical protein